MRDILMADLFRLRKQKSTWIFPLVTFIVLFLFGCIKGFLLGNAGWLKVFHEAITGGISATVLHTRTSTLRLTSILSGTTRRLPRSS